jgi:hypothetical protein
MQDKVSLGRALPVALPQDTGRARAICAEEGRHKVYSIRNPRTQVDDVGEHQRRVTEMPAVHTAQLDRINVTTPRLIRKVRVMRQTAASNVTGSMSQVHFSFPLYYDGGKFSWF